MTIATILTFMRLALVPFLVYVLWIQHWALALLLYIVSLITDVLDGYLARRLHQQTVFGATLDPIVDKLMNVSCLYVLAHYSFVPLWFFAFVAIKEILLLVGALYICFVRPCVPVGALYAGKVAGLVQAAYIGAVFVQAATGFFPGIFLDALLYLSFFTCLYALVYYAIIGFNGMFTCKK